MSTPLAIAAIAGFKVKLPNGKIVVAKSPTLKQAARFMGLIGDWEKGKPEAETLDVLLTDFPPAVGLTDEDLADLSLAEFRDTVVSFLSLRRGKFEAILPAVETKAPSSSDPPTT